MAEHCGYVIKVAKLLPHPNADKLQLLEVFNTMTCVSLDVKVGDIGIYFPSGLQLSEEFCIQNHLLRKLPDGTPDTGYMDPNKRNVTTIKLRGEPSDGLYVPASAFEYIAVLGEDEIGKTIDTYYGHPICCKYIPKVKNHQPNPNSGTKKNKKPKVPIAPLFQEHADTEQLAYNLRAFKPGDQVEITLKMHGTSQRTGYLPTLKKMKRSLLDVILRRPGKPVYDWGYVTGTRRMVLETYEGGYYGNNAFREQHAKKFEGKLHKGETVYYEVVGFTDTGAPIMGSAGNKSLGKDFVKQYGETTVFSYNCEPDGKRTTPAYKDENGEPFSLALDWPQSDFYVYRMTMTNEDGDTVEYTPDFMRYRCEQMGVKTVPVFTKFFIDNGLEGDCEAGKLVADICKLYNDGPDPIGKTHVREGVVARIVNRPTFTAYKDKNFSFKCLTGIITDQANDTDANLSEDILSEL